MRVNVITPYTIAYSSVNRKNTSFMQVQDREKMIEYADLRVFHHHIYEYRKGIRNLILTTEKGKYRDYIENRLKNERIDYVIHEIADNKINVYFGEKSCVDVVKTFNPKLNKLTPEQDFMLGIMLGYDRVKQCDRYLKRSA